MSTHLPSISILLLAGGRGLRMHMSILKQFLTLREKPIALYSFETLCTYPASELVCIHDSVRPFYIEFKPQNHNARRSIFGFLPE